MMKFSLEFAWEHGCTEVMLLSGAQNVKAHRLYEQLGFDKHRKTGFVIFRPDQMPDKNCIIAGPNNLNYAKNRNQ
jgi:hypothetical protein